jgi:putative Mg2+ transporter-C (MgtC) family protein
MELLTNTVGVVATKLVLAVVLGGLLGLERSLARKTAGMRTYTLVSMGAALFVILAEIVGQHYMELGIRNFDPLRVASQIIVGIGFLGAGLIIFQDNKLRGLTTAAGLWVAAGLGMAVGYGLYVVAAMVTILTLFVFTGLWYVERYIEKHAPAPNQRED